MAPYEHLVNEAAQPRGIRMRRVQHPIPDMGALPVDAYDEIVSSVREGPEHGGVFVHCWGGIGRTAPSSVVSSSTGASRPRPHWLASTNSARSPRSAPWLRHRPANRSMSSASAAESSREALVLSPENDRDTQLTLAELLDHCLDVTGWISADAATWATHISRVSELLARRPVST